MPSTTPPLGRAAAAIIGLGSSQAEIDLLDDDALQAGLRMIRDLERELQPYRLWLAAAVARRSDHTLGYRGLARKNGFPTPAVLIQRLTETSLDEATRLARLGAMVVDAESARPVVVDDDGRLTVGSSDAALATAAAAGGISLDCAESIRRGLGSPDDAVSAEQLRVEAERLIAHSSSSSIVSIMTPEALLKLARQARERLDADAVERGQKQRSDSRAVRIWERDGMSGGSWKLAAEDGGADIHTALKLLLARQTGGPRFPETDEHGDQLPKSAAEAALEDDRSMDQILADGFVQIFLNGLRVDPSVVPGAGRAAVRVVVTREALESAASGDGTSCALLEENLSAITLAKLGEFLCEGGTVGVILNEDGTLDVGREQRLFTRRQRIALAVRDGGCRFPGCTKPVSWTEAHHIAYWARDGGKTEIENGILLCRYHHMFIHDRGWEIHRDAGPAGGTFWLTPPAYVDPQRTPLRMPPKNPLMAALAGAVIPSG